MNEPGFGVYVHWPFCARKCPYCDFNSHVRTGAIDETRYLAAFVRELRHVAALTGRRVVTSVFFGGGTPSLLAPATAAAILDTIGAVWKVAPDAEVTLEANPGSVEAARFRGYRDAGVNRVSLGVQSLRDDALKKLGRVHGAAEAKAAIELARRTFDRFSFDLIYARENQTVAGWRAELREALALAGNHLSLYQLTIEPDTPFARWHAAGNLTIPDDDTARALYELTQELTERAGLPAYEISNYARPGEESRHNLLYWRYGEYAGIGPGAHGRLLMRQQRQLSTSFPRRREPLSHRNEGVAATMRSSTPHRSAPEAATDPVPIGNLDSRLRGNDVEKTASLRLHRHVTATERQPERWLALVEAHGHGILESEPLSERDQADEMLLMGMRLREGLDLGRFAHLTGLSPSPEGVAELREAGLVACEGASRSLAVTRAGRLVLDAIVTRLAGSLTPLTPSRWPC